MGFMIHLIHKASSSSSVGLHCTFVHSMVQNRFVSVRGRNFIFTGAGLGKNDHLAFGIWHSGTTQVQYTYILWVGFGNSQ